MAIPVAGQYYEVDGQLWEIKRQLRQKGGYPFNINLLRLHLQAAIEGCFIQAETAKFSKVISPPLIIDPTDGSQGLADAADLFVSIDSDFKNYGADELGHPTVEMPVVVREMCDNSTFAQMFGELSYNVGKICLTPHQIKVFVQKHCQWLRTDCYVTLFLYKSHDNFLVACVDVCSSDELSVEVCRVGLSSVLDAECRNRLVVPQLQW